MFTGNATFDAAIHGMKLGAFDYLMKPCDLEQLVAKVEEAKAKLRKHEERSSNRRSKCSERENNPSKVGRRSRGIEGEP